LLWMMIPPFTVKGQKFLKEGEEIFSSESDCAVISPGDLEADGDVDLFLARERELFWIENTGGDQIFDPIQSLSEYPEAIRTFVLEDITGDKYPDLIVAFGSVLSWYENSQLGSFGTAAQFIDSLSSVIQAMHAADLDGDGDLDLAVATKRDNLLLWFENSDASGTFLPGAVITNSVDLVQQIYAADLDGDGDKDLLTASAYDDKIAWYENTDGTGTFGDQQVISANADCAWSVCAKDLNGNGFPDVLSASAFDDKIAWYANTDGLGSFSEEGIISLSSEFPQYVKAEDLDGDGDQDVLAASYFDHKIVWFENTNGKGDFGKENLISTKMHHAEYVYSPDLDGDSDPDILAISSDPRISWHENTLPLFILKSPLSRFFNPNSTIELSLTANEYALGYQWQSDSGNGFRDLENSSVFQGVNTDRLLIPHIDPSVSGQLFRCLVSGTPDSLYSYEARLLIAPGDTFYYADENCQVTVQDYTGGLDYVQVPLPGSGVSQNTEVLFYSRDSVYTLVHSLDLLVIDNTAPRFTVFPGDQELEIDLDGDPFLPNYAGNIVEAEDNCSRPEDIKITQFPDQYSLLTDSLTRVIIVAEDEHGNFSKDSFQVRLVDHISPEITCRADQVLDLEEGAEQYEVHGAMFDPVLVSDNDHIAEVWNSFNNSPTLDGARLQPGLTRIEWTAVDDYGNQASCDFNVLIQGGTRAGFPETIPGSFYPNPSTGVFYYSSGGEKVVNLKLMDVTGMVLLEESELSGECSIDLSAYGPGIYICVVLKGDYTFMHRLIKQ